MIDISSVDVHSLESVPLSNKSKLPSFPGIYFAIDDNGVVQYIGQTFNIKVRWRWHHRFNQLSKMENVKIAFIRIDDVDMLPTIERQFIIQFAPPLNRGVTLNESLWTIIPKKDPPKKRRGMLVRMTLIAKCPNLGQRIKEAKDQSGKSVKQVCWELGISRQTWYNIENQTLKEGLDYDLLQRIEECLGTSFGVKF